LANLKKEKPALVQFLMKQERARECRMLSIESFLVMPVQQIPRYVMLVQDLAKNTWKGHPDFDNLNQAHAKLKEVATKINEKKRESENQAKVYGVQRTLSGKFPTLCTPSRRYVREDQVNYLRKVILKPLHLYLFNDLLVLAQPKFKTSNIHYKIGLEIDSNFSVSKVDNEKRAPHALKIVGHSSASTSTTSLLQRKKHEYVVSFPSAADREAFISECAKLKSKPT